MGIPDGAHTHGHGGGSGLGEVLVILLAVALLGPDVAAAMAELVHVLLIVAGVIVGVDAAGLAGLLAWQLRRTRVDAARAMPPRTLVARPAPPLLQARRAGELPAAPNVNLQAGFIFTSTAWTTRTSPPSLTGRMILEPWHRGRCSAEGITRPGRR